MNVKLMKYLCSSTQEVLKNTVHSYLLKKYDNVIHTHDYLFAEGTLPICLVAHLDTVFPNTPNEIYYDQEQKVMWSPQGLGADDRAGVYAILEILEAGYRPSVVFTTNEEIGGLGALKLIEDYPECPFSNLKAIIELDRQGEKDCVFYDCDNVDFENYIHSFGFTPAFGTFSDISFIAPQWGAAAVNLSVGYVNEHSERERLFAEHLDATIERVKEILNKSISMMSYAYIPLDFSFVFDCAICSQPLCANNCETVKVQGVTFHICNNCYNQYYKSNSPKRHKKKRK